MCALVWGPGLPGGAVPDRSGRPFVVDGVAVHSSLDPCPPAGSPLAGYGGPLRWTPASHADIAASVAWHARPWWRRVGRRRPAGVAG